MVISYLQYMDMLCSENMIGLERRPGLPCLIDHIMLKTEDFLLALQRYCRYHTDGHSSGHGWTGRPCHIAMSCRTLTLYVIFSSLHPPAWVELLLSFSSVGWVGRALSLKAEAHKRKRSYLRWWMNSLFLRFRRTHWRRHCRCVSDDQAGPLQLLVSTNNRLPSALQQSKEAATWHELSCL